MTISPSELVNGSLHAGVEAYVSADQLADFNALLKEVVPQNRFQREHLGGVRTCATRAAFAALPWLRKAELVADAAANPPFGTNLTYPLEAYRHYHQTSGTTGVPLPVLDTAESWAGWTRCWREVLFAAGFTPDDRVFFAFSFGPFVGFWSAYEAARSLGALCVPGGGASSRQRLSLMQRAGCTALLSTPSYALHLAEVAAQDGLDLKSLGVQRIIVAGEPGGSIPSTQRSIEAAWGAKVYDHAGATEVGAWGISHRQGLRVNEREFIAEVVDPESGEHVAPNGLGTGELVITTLGRAAWPVVRYRTSDIVRPLRSPNGALILLGGIIGRTDNMVTVRGVNVFPSAVEEVVRAVAGSAEFRITASRRGTLDEVAIEVEEEQALCDRVAAELRLRIGLRFDVRAVPPQSLPRWEGKARRFVRECS